MQSNNLNKDILSNQEAKIDNWKIEDHLLDEEWRDLLKDEFKKKYFIEINNFLTKEYQEKVIKPPRELVFNAFNSTKIDNIKAVILGQDPYHGDNQAHGLAFSVTKGVRIPPSLRNIFIELKNDIPEFEMDEGKSGCLQRWSNEGVFLLNSFLTVELHKPASHSKIGWNLFTDKVIKTISERNSGCVFMLWGNFAQKKENLIQTDKHMIIKCAHPSPLSVKKFFGSKCFSRANEFLKLINKSPIKWCLR